MPRANRHFLPGYVWHITHRCHKQEFLLKFARDRDCWVHWLFEARKRFGLCVLNYIVTSNHIHLLVRDSGKSDIPKSMQLIAGRTAQEYNRRKGRKGAFWEDRYYATAIDTCEYLARCLVYIDLNMVRAGVVDHPRDWKHGGYHEVQVPHERYRIIDRTQLSGLLGLNSTDQLERYHQLWVEEALAQNRLQREAHWTESVAVGSQCMTESVLEQLKYRGRGRELSKDNDTCVIKEPPVPYKPHFGVKQVF